MKVIRRIIVGLGFTIAASCLVAIVLFNWSVTGWKALTVPTSSMQPNIKPGSVVLIHRVPVSTLKSGDIITYLNPQNTKMTISHRIIKMYYIKGNIPAFVTKGDANPSPDMPIVGGLIKGKVIASIPLVGSALNWSHTLLGIFIIIYLPALIIMIQEIRRLAAYYRQFTPYKSALILAREKAMSKSGNLKRRLISVPVFATVLLTGSVFLAFPVHALLRSNVVSLDQNTLVAAPTKPTTSISTTSCQSNSNISVNSTTNQTAVTSSVNNSNNTSASSGIGGNAANNNTSNVSISVTNC